MSHYPEWLSGLPGSVISCAGGPVAFYSRDAGSGWAATVLFAAFFGAVFLAGLAGALRSFTRRFKRAFFFACPLRRFIFIEFLLSCFPTARKMPP
ncbi:MAG: hypothetical protein ACREJ3_16495 [Polyangiaceae bacterium]